MLKKKKRKKQQKKEIIDEFKTSEKDTGSTKVQIGILTKEIKELNEHLKRHIHDFSSRRGLLKKVSQRRKLLKYLEVHDPKNYEEMLKKIKK
ncbi:30S ribosomal protein S15 [Patescibacteria group bacterium AH-259-L07]|nr:30S ribosomal protein S15 [Patescibacteria group bacterium AH-259-L07]